jgi:hypothetical protein
LSKGSRTFQRCCTRGRGFSSPASRTPGDIISETSKLTKHWSAVTGATLE